MALTLARSVAVRYLSFSLLPKRLFSTTATLTTPPRLPSAFLCRRSLPALSRAAPSLFSATRFTAIRCRVNRSGNSAYSPLNSGSNFSDRPPTEMAPLFPGCDYEHWLIVMDKPGGEGATKQQMIDCYIQTLAKVVGRWFYFLATYTILFPFFCCVCCFMRKYLFVVMYAYVSVLVWIYVFIHGVVCSWIRYICHI